MASRNPERPNLLIILTDDQGAWAMGGAGNTEIRSPNLDRLAREGIRFDNFFCASPVCSPARASIMTGRIPSQHGVHGLPALASVDRRRRLESFRALLMTWSFSPVCRPTPNCSAKSATAPA